MSNDNIPSSTSLDYGERSSVFRPSTAVAREKREPVTDSQPISLLAFLFGAIILSLGCLYLGIYSGGFKMDRIYAEDNYAADPRPMIVGVVMEEDTRTWIEKWMDGGKTVYSTCVACHMPNGLGVPGQFPPLDESEWVVEGTERLAALLFPGIQGPLSVKGNLYNGLMPGQGAILTDREIAQVMTYIRRSWNNDESIVTEEMVKVAREKYGSRSAPWTEGELLAIPGGAMLPGAEVNLETGEPLGAGEG